MMQLLVDDELALHSHVAESTEDATLERIAARRLRDEFNRHDLILWQLPAILGRCKNQTRRAIGGRAIGIDVDFESVIAIRCRDSKLNLSSLLDVDRRRCEFVFLRGHIDDLRGLILRRGLLLMRKSASRQKCCEDRQQESAKKRFQRLSPFMDLAASRITPPKHTCCHNCGKRALKISAGTAEKEVVSMTIRTAGAHEVDSSGGVWNSVFGIPACESARKASTPRRQFFI